MGLIAPPKRYARSEEFVMLRKIENARERVEQLNRSLANRREEAARQEAALDDMVRRNIQLYGP